MEAKRRCCCVLWTLLMLLQLSVKLALPERVYERDEVMELVRRQTGYKIEAHLVDTEDGYVLKVHRMYRKNPKKVKPPVFLQHGLFASSGDFVLTGKSKALAFFLADSDYDVWMGNIRGSRNSLRHRRLSSESDGKFWNFSFHEFGLYDLPAMINYMLKMSGHEKCYYVGHSQGTTTFIAMMALRSAEFNNKIIQAHLLAPAVFMDNAPHPQAGLLAEVMTGPLFTPYAFIDLRPYWGIATNFLKTFCGPNMKSTLPTCHNLLFAIVGGNRDNIEIDDNILKYLADFASPRVSVNQGRHYMQNYYSRQFRMFDYGWQRNMIVYNSTEPPAYDLGAIQAPIYLYAGQFDLIVGIKDVGRLYASLPNARDFRVIKNFNHLDFTYGKNAKQKVYYDILRAMEDEKSNRRY